MSYAIVHVCTCNNSTDTLLLLLLLVSTHVSICAGIMYYINFFIHVNPC